MASTWFFFPTHMQRCTDGHTHTHTHIKFKGCRIHKAGSLARLQNDFALSRPSCSCLLRMQQRHCNVMRSSEAPYSMFFYQLPHNPFPAASRRLLSGLQITNFNDLLLLIMVGSSIPPSSVHARSCRPQRGESGVEG